jgi:hypothetical protein
MFFDNTVAIVHNIRSVMKPGATITNIVWRTPDGNPWLSMAKGIVPPLGIGAQTCGAGPFSMQSQDMVAGMMKSAGFTGIELQRVDAPVLVGKTVQDAIAFQLALRPAREVFREAGDEAEEERDQVEAALADAIGVQKKEPDVIVMDSSS